MITKKYFSQIRVKIRDIKKVLDAYNAIDEKGFIEFSPAGIFSGNVDVIYENFNLLHELMKTCNFIDIKDTVEFYCMDPNEVRDEYGNLISDFVTKKELKEAIELSHTEWYNVIKEEIKLMFQKLNKESADDKNTDQVDGNTVRMESVNIQFVHSPIGEIERTVIVNGEEYFKDKSTYEGYGELKDPLRELELWLFDMEIRRAKR